MFCWFGDDGGDDGGVVVGWLVGNIYYFFLLRRNWQKLSEEERKDRLIFCRHYNKDFLRWLLRVRYSPVRSDDERTGE